ncbi:MAG: XRE family transcriptional regulator [Gammaproteobacteria bacterium]|nr:XRE family transcriptional regulator [Gammaproteobacteria bacterium]
MIGERIQQARKASGLSLRALAEKAGVSAMAISKYENNKSTPSSGVMLALAKALQVRTEYFLRRARVELREVEYRKHVSLPKKVLDQIEGDVIEQIERFIELEELLPVNPIQVFKLPKSLPKQIEDYERIESIVLEIRKAWGLGNNPIPDLIDTLEERGIKVFQSIALHDEKFDGLAATVNSTPVIVVGRDWPGDRQRFTLAHELGHLVLKNRLAEGLDEEKAANRFAGAFLVPAAEAIKELGSTRSWLEPVELCVLKQTYGLSMRGWIYRASDLNILNKAASKKMWDYFRSRNWIKKEPGKQYPAEKPKLFTQLVFHAYGEELVSDSKAAELMGMSLVDFRKMRNVGSCEQDITDQ